MIGRVTIAFFLTAREVWASNSLSKRDIFSFVGDDSVSSNYGDNDEVGASGNKRNSVNPFLDEIAAGSRVLVSDFDSSFKNIDVPVDSEAIVNIELYGGGSSAVEEQQEQQQQQQQEHETVSDNERITVKASGKNFVFNDIHSNHFVVKFDASFDYLSVPASTGQQGDQPLRLTFGVDNIDARVTLTNPIDENHFRHMQRLGSTMQHEQIFPCLVPFNVDINNLEYFTLAVNAHGTPFWEEMSSESSTANNAQASLSWLSGFIPQAQSAVLDEHVDVMLPSIFDLALQPLVHRFMVMAADEMNCNDLKFMDFRDFFLTPAESIALGGSGRAPYGNVGFMAHGILNEAASSIDEDGMSMLNEMIPRQIEFPGELFTFGMSNPLNISNFQIANDSPVVVPMEEVEAILDIDHIEFGLHNLRAENLNTILPPVGFLKPIAHPHKLQNEFTIGLPGKRLNVTINPKVGLTTGDSGILNSMYNDFDFGFSIDDFEFAFDFLLTLPTYEFLQFPLKDFLDIPCWIALVPVNDNPDEGFQILTFLSRLRGLAMHLKCNDCTSETFNSTIPLMLEILNDEVEENDDSTGGATTLALFGYKFGLLVEEIMMSEFAQASLDNAVEFAPLFCPHRPEYDEDATENATLFFSAAGITTDIQAFPNLEEFTEAAALQLVEGVNEGLEEYDELPVPILFPYLSNDSLDTVYFTVVMAAHTGLVAIAGMITDLIRPEYEGRRMLSYNGGGREGDASKSSSPKSLLNRMLNQEIDVEHFYGIIEDYSFLLDFMQPLNCTDPGAMQDLPFEIPVTMPEFDLSYDPSAGYRRLMQVILSESITDSQVPRHLQLGEDLLSFRDLNIDLDLKVELGGREYRIDRMSVVGLDTLKDYENTTIKSDEISAGFAIDNVRVEIDLVVLAPTDDVLGKEHPTDTDYTISMSFGVEDVLAAFSLYFDIDDDQVEVMTLGSLLTISNVPQCLISTIEKFELQTLDVSVGGLDYLNIHGFESQHIARATEEFQQRMEEEFTDIVLQSIPVVFNPLGRVVINEGAKFVTDTFSDCPLVSGTGDSYIDFRDLFYPPDVALLHGGSGEEQYGDIVHTVFNFILNQIGTDPETGASKVNNLLRSSCPDLPPYYNVSYGMRGDIYAMVQSIFTGSYGMDFNLKFSDLSIENVDTIGPLKILNVTNESPYELNNAVSIGVGGRPLRIKFDFYVFFHFQNQGEWYDPVENDVEFIIDMYSPTVTLDGFLKMPEKNLMEYPILEILNVNCILAMLPIPELDEEGYLTTHDPELLGFGITSFEAVLEQLHLQVNCRNCTSYLLYELSDILNSKEGIEGFTAFVNRVLDYLTTVLQERIVLDQIGKLIVDSAKQCPISPEYDPNFKSNSGLLAADFLIGPDEVEMPDWRSSIAGVFTFTSVVVVIVSAAVILLLHVWLKSRRAQQEWLSGISDGQYYVIHEKQRILQEIEKEVDATTTSLLMSPDIPLFWRLMVPVIVVGNIGFFLSGHLSLGGAAAAMMSFGGEDILIPKFEPMSVWIMVNNMFELGSHAAGVIAMLFSIIWPYFKQMVSLCVWCAPPRYLPSALRGQIFEWLDALAKWSMLDIFIMVITCGGMFFDYTSPDVDFLPERMYHFTLMAIPLWGLYANMIAQLISQVSSHFIIHYHRHVVRVAKKRIHHKLSIAHLNYDNHMNDPSSERITTDENGEEVVVERKTRLCDHHFAIPHGEPYDTCVAKRWVVVMLYVVAVTIFALQMATSFLPAMTFHFHGLVGILIDVSQGMDKITSYNPWDFCWAFILQGFFIDRVGDWIGLVSICTLYIATVLIVPILQMLALIILWVVPMTDKYKKRMLVVIEVLIAWEYGEVFLFAVGLEAWMFEPLTTTIFNPFCGDLDYILSQLNHYGILSDADTQCYKVSLGVNSGSYTLVFSVFLLYLLTGFVTRAAMQYFREKEGCDLVPPHDVADDMLKAAALVAASNIDAEGETDKEEEEEDQEDDSEEDEEADVEREMRPFPFLFTDAFALAMHHSNIDGIDPMELQKAGGSSASLSNVESTSTLMELSQLET